MSKNVSTPLWLTALLIATIVAGVWLRFHALAHPVVFEDESITWLYVSGTTEEAWTRHLFNGRVHSVAELATFQHRRAGHGVFATVRALATSDPQHPPLFYAAERAWVGLFGDSLASRRSLSALAGTVLIAALAWLCWEVFGTSLAALVGAALAAVSPMHIAFSQQAREYELWAALICCSSAGLIAAVRRPTARNWLGYAVLLSLMLCTHALSFAVVGAQMVWAAVTSYRRPGVVLAFFACLGAALLVNAPWIVNLALHSANAADANAWSATAWPLKFFLSKWAFNLSATFFDLLFVQTRFALLGAVVLVLELAALVALPRVAERDGAAFIFCLVGVCAGALVLPDLVLHGHRSTYARYELPVFLGLEVAVAGFLAGGATQPRRTVRFAGYIVLCAALCAGIVSARARATRDSWWENSKDAALPAIASRLNAEDDPLLVVESDELVAELVNTLSPRVRILAIRSDNASWVPPAAPIQTYLLNPSAALRSRLAAGGSQLVPVPLAGAQDAGLQAFRTDLDRERRAQSPALDASPGETSLWRVLSRLGGTGTRSPS